MQETFYGLLKEYLRITRECDVFQEQALAAPEGIERERVMRALELTRKRCAALRREIRRYPDVNTLPQSSAPDNSPRFVTQVA